MTVGVQIFDKRTGYIREPSRFGEGRHFCGGKANAQGHGLILPQRETRYREVIIMSDMRSLIVYMTLLALLVLSIGAGFVASDWPRWCHMAHWCGADWLAGR